MHGGVFEDKTPQSVIQRMCFKGFVLHPSLLLFWARTMRPLVMKFQRQVTIASGCRQRDCERRKGLQVD
jgi:hypothetical protein